MNYMGPGRMHHRVCIAACLVPLKRMPAIKLATYARPSYLGVSHTHACIMLIHTYWTADVSLPGRAIAALINNSAVLCCLWQCAWLYLKCASLAIHQKILLFQLEAYARASFWPGITSQQITALLQSFTRHQSERLLRLANHHGFASGSLSRACLPLRPQHNFEHTQITPDGR